MNRIKQLRDEKGMNQTELGKIIGVTSQAMGMYENEKRGIDTNIASILADFFGVSIDYLMCKSDIRNPEGINIDDADVSFVTGVKGLNETNKMIIKNTLEALLAKQEQDKENKEEK